MPGRPPKPTELLLLTGAARKNPKRIKARAGEPVPPAGGVGDPPERFMIFEPDIGYQRAAKLRAMWAKSVKMWPWITYSDRDSLEDYCEFRVDKESGVKLSAQDKKLMVQIRGELGGTGAGRARMGIRSSGAAAAPAKAADPRATFLGRKVG